MPGTKVCFRSKYILPALLVLSVLTTCLNLTPAQDVRFSKSNLLNKNNSLDTLLAKAAKDQSLLPSVIAATLARSPFPQMRGPEAPQYLSGILRAEISTRSKDVQYLHESVIIDAFKTWCSLSASPCEIDDQSVYDLHAYRLHVAHFLPNLSLRNPNGNVSSYVTPLEAVYFFNELIRDGAIPSVDIKGGEGSALVRKTGRLDPNERMRLQRAATNSYYAQTTPANAQNISHAPSKRSESQSRQPQREDRRNKMLRLEMFKRVRPASAALMLGLLVLFTCGFDGGCLGLGGGPDPLHIIVSNTKYTKGALVGAVPRPDQKVMGQRMWDAVGEGDPPAHGSVTGFGFDGSVKTDWSGKATVYDARLNAYWNFGVTFDPTCVTNYPTLAAVTLYVLPTAKVTDAHHNVGIECALLTDSIPPVRTYPYFDVANPPSLINIPAATDLSNYSPYSITALVYDRNGQLVASTSGTSILSDGVTTTFPTPYVAPDVYGVALVGSANDGTEHFLGTHTLVAGSTQTNFPHAFGVDGASTASSDTVCQTPDPYNDGTYAGQTTCNTWNSQSRFPVVSLYDANQLSFNGQTVSLSGVHPTSVLTFGFYNNDDFEQQAPGNFWENQDQGTQYALVLNSGSSSVSVVDLEYAQEAHVISVAAQPTAVSIDPAAMRAYVVSFGGTLTRIDLSNFTVTGTTYVGLHPTAITVNGNETVTVGGENFLASVDGNAMSVISSQSTNSIAVALASTSDSQYIFTSGLATGGPSNISILRMATNLSGASMLEPSLDATPYASSGLSSSLVKPTIMGNGMRAGMGVLDYIVATTPQGFEAFDSSGSLLIRGEIPGLTRSIGLDPDGTVAYFASADNNAVVSVPLPQLPTPDPTELHFLAQ